MNKRLMVVFGLLLAGCSVSPSAKLSDTAGVTTGSLSLALAGDGYSVQSILAQPSLSYSAINFHPTKIEIHYSGAIAAGEALPADIDAQVSDQSGANLSDETDADPTAQDGQWIAIPVKEGSDLDLTKLGNTEVTLGEGLFKTGRYDKIRLTGAGNYQALDGSTPKSGDYVLPSGRLYLNQGFEIREGYQTALAFSFDASQAMVTAGTKVILKPTSVKVFAKYAPIATPSTSPSVSPSPEATASPAV